jgi:hypothetical protein
MAVNYNIYAGAKLRLTLSEFGIFDKILSRLSWSLVALTTEVSEHLYISADIGDFVTAILCHNGFEGHIIYE